MGVESMKKAELTGIRPSDKKKTERFFVRLPVDRFEQVVQAAYDAGVPVTTFAGMLVWSGYQAHLRATNPEKVFSPEDWKLLLEVFQNAGVTKDE